MITRRPFDGGIDMTFNRDADVEGILVKYNENKALTRYEQTVIIRKYLSTLSAARQYARERDEVHAVLRTYKSLFIALANRFVAEKEPIDEEGLGYRKGIRQ